MIAGDSYLDEVFFEDFNVNTIDPKWTVKERVNQYDANLSGLVGLRGFRAINIPYKNAVNNQMIMIFGGLNRRLGNGGYLTHEIVYYWSCKNACDMISCHSFL